MTPGRYFFSANRRIFRGEFTGRDLRTVIASNREREVCPWCENTTYSSVTGNCAECDTFPATSRTPVH